MTISALYAFCKLSLLYHYFFSFIYGLALMVSEFLTPQFSKSKILYCQHALLAVSLCTSEWELIVFVFVCWPSLTILNIVYTHKNGNIKMKMQCFTANPRRYKQDIDLCLWKQNERRIRKQKSSIKIHSFAHHIKSLKSYLQA